MTGYIEKTHGQVAVSAFGTQPAQTSDVDPHVGPGKRPLRRRITGDADDVWSAWTDPSWKLAANHLPGRYRRTPLGRFVKNRIFLGLCVILGASFISVRAADTPAQAAARVALVQKMYELDHPQILPSVPIIPSKTAVKQPGQSAANVTGTVFTKAATPQTAPAPTTPVAALAAVVVAMSHLIVSHLIVSFLVLLLLIVSLLLLKLWQQKLKLRRLDSRI